MINDATFKFRFGLGNIILNKIKKSLGHSEAIRTPFQELTDRRRRLQAQHLNVHGEFDRWAPRFKLLVAGRTKVAGVHLEMAATNSFIEGLHEAHISERSFDEIFAGRI